MLSGRGLSVHTRLWLVITLSSIDCRLLHVFTAYLRKSIFHLFVQNPHMTLTPSFLNFIKQNVKGDFCELEELALTTSNQKPISATGLNMPRASFIVCLSRRWINLLEHIAREAHHLWRNLEDQIIS
jgi:hypothetical protein